jgi:type I restriction enzyme, S subunit
VLTNSMSFGRPYIMNTSGCIHDGWLLLRPRNHNVSPDFFYYLLGSDFVYSEFVRRASGATVKNLNTDLVKDVRVPLPPLAEQRRIAVVLDRAEALRAKRRAILGQLDGLTQSIFLDLFGDPIWNPRGFPFKRLIQLVDPERGISYGVVQRGDHLAGGIPLVRIGDVIEGEISLEHLKRTSPDIARRYKRTVLRGGELVISIRGTVGRCAYVPKELANGNITRELALIPQDQNQSWLFLQTLLRNRSVQEKIGADVRGVAQRGINLKQLRDLPVIQPAKELVKKFERSITAIEHLKKLHHTSEVAHSHLFGALQHHAFRGDL